MTVILNWEVWDYSSENELYTDTLLLVIKWFPYYLSMLAGHKMLWTSSCTFNHLTHELSSSLGYRGTTSKKTTKIHIIHKVCLIISDSLCIGFFSKCSPELIPNLCLHEEELVVDSGKQVVHNHFIDQALLPETEAKYASILPGRLLTPVLQRTWYPSQSTR